MDYPQNAIGQVADKLIKHVETNTRIINDLAESINQLIVNNQMIIDLIKEQNKKLKENINA